MKHPRIAYPTEKSVSCSPIVNLRKLIAYRYVGSMPKETQYGTLPRNIPFHLANNRSYVFRSQSHHRLPVRNRLPARNRPPARNQFPTRNRFLIAGSLNSPVIPNHSTTAGFILPKTQQIFRWALLIVCRRVQKTRFGFLPNAFLYQGSSKQFSGSSLNRQTH